MKIYILLIVLIVAVISSCPTTKKTVVTAESIVSKMQSKYPNYTAAELTNGRTL